MTSKHAWMDQGSCTDQAHDPRWWDIDHPNLWWRGTPICTDCPVRIDCLRYAHGNPLLSGIYGGIAIKNGNPLT